MNKKIICMIPVRIGSTRLKLKNLALVNGKPLVYYSIKSAKDSLIFDNIFVNSDDILLKKITDRYNIDFYKRPKKLGGNNIKSDEVVANFLYKNNCDILVWVNSIAPLQKSQEISEIVKYFSSSNYDSLYTVIDRKVHAILNNKSLNFNKKVKFQQTQELEPIKEMVYSLMMWKSKKFIKNYEKYGNAFLRGKIKYYNVGINHSFIVKNIDDLNIIDTIMKSKDKKFNLKYDRIIK
tara:strand:- start:789 stop:1496 length:708 start_codon:yes stop_codon:yes gene_type:complete